MCSFWKHANLDVIKARSGKRLEQNRRLGVVGIAIVREPLAWLQGIRRAPYDYQHPPRNDVRAANWLQRNFTTSELFYGGEPAVTFPSLGEIWSNHTRAYEHLDKYGFDRRLVLKYEELVLDTENAVSKIAQVLGLPPPISFQQVEVPAKDGASGGHAQAVEKLKTKSHIELFSKEELRQACDSLDRQAMRRHGYGLCDRLVPVAVQKTMKPSVNMATNTELPKGDLTTATKHEPNRATEPHKPAMATNVSIVSNLLMHTAKPRKGAATVSEMGSARGSANPSERNFAKSSKQSAIAKTGTLESTKKVSTDRKSVV